MAIGFLLGFVCALCVATLAYLCSMAIAGPPQPQQPVMGPLRVLVLERVEEDDEDEDDDWDEDEPGGERLPWEGDAEAWRKQ